MSPLTNFNKLQQLLSISDFKDLCKTIILEKDNRAKIVVQKAQQFLDECKQKKSVAVTTDL